MTAKEAYRCASRWHRALSTGFCTEQQHSDIMELFRKHGMGQIWNNAGSHLYENGVSVWFLNLPIEYPKVDLSWMLPLLGK